MNLVLKCTPEIIPRPRVKSQKILSLLAQRQLRSDVSNKGTDAALGLGKFRDHDILVMSIFFGLKYSIVPLAMGGYGSIFATFIIYLIIPSKI